MAKVFNKEGHVKEEVKRLLTQHKWFWWMPAAFSYGQVGVSDILALRHGVFLAIETKFGSRKPTALQRNFLKKVAEQDGLAFVVTEKTIEVFREWMDAFDQSVKDVSHGLKPALEDKVTMLDATKQLTGDLQ